MPNDVPSYDARNGKREEFPPGAAESKEANLPTIKIRWNAELQIAVLEFEPTEFKTWDMVIAVLEMGMSQAKFNQNIGRMQGLQQQAAQAMQAQAIRNKIKI
jgi:hypothetical protein